MIVTVAPAKEEDLIGLIARSNFAAIPESHESLLQHIRASEDAWVGKADGVTACAWGVIPPSMIGTQAYLWIVTSDIVDQHKFVFIRYSQRVVEVLLQKYETLIGFCDNPSSVRWLKMLGARFKEPQNEKMPFEIRRK